MYMKFKMLQIKLIRKKDRETKEKNKGVGYRKCTDITRISNL